MPVSAILVALVLACPPVVPSVGRVQPENGETGVAANAAIVFESTVRDGSVTAMVVVTSAMGGFSGPAILGAGDVFVFDPGADLPVGNWTATISLMSGAGGFDKTIAFVVSEPADIAAPVLAGDVAFDIGNYVDAPAFEDCPDPPGVYAVAADWPDATDTSSLLYAVRGILLGGSQVTIGAPAGETLGLEVFAYDIAGNLAALPVALLDVPGPPGDGGGGCGCRFAPEAGAPGQGSSPWVLALAAVAIALRRRR